MNFDTNFVNNVIPSNPLADIDPIVIIDGCRTPILKAKKNKNELILAPKVDRLLVACLKGLLTRTDINVDLIDDIIVGNVLQPGAGAAMSRMSALEVGIPHTTSIATVNRQCSSGLQAIAVIAGSLLMGSIDIGIAAGVESMTHDGNAMFTKPNLEWNFIQKIPAAIACTLPMGVTSDNVAIKFNITRSEQDLFAMESHRRAKLAQIRGEYAQEIIPVPIPSTTLFGKIIGSNSGQYYENDDGIRHDCTLVGLKKLKTAFTSESKGGTTTAGNASQRSDGAAAVLMMRLSRAKQLGYQPLIVLRSFAVKGVSPELMGIGPAIAIPEALKQAQLTINQIDLFEINEAFASQCLYCIQYLGLDSNKVNPGGGGIALGHPLGSTGTRLIVSAMYRLRREQKRYAVVSMCIGTGMGAAAVIENTAYMYDPQPDAFNPNSKL